MRSLVLLVALGLALPAAAQTGPGLGNLSYDQAFEPVGYIESPGGHGNVTLVQGYLMVIYSSDGGGRADDGGIELWDVSDPTAPTVAVAYENEDTHGLREAHGFSLAWHEDRLILAAQAIDGVQLWDVTDPFDLQLLSYLDLEGIDRGDYSGDWWIFWQAPTLYVAGVDSGLFVVDATLPEDPVLQTHLETGALAGVSPAQVFALGNLLVVMESQGLDFATLDISNPFEPQVLRRVSGKSGYSHLFAGDGLILTSGNIPPRGHVHRVDASGNIQHEATFGLYFDSGGYGTYQDGAFHSGFSDHYVKFDLATEEEIGRGSSGREGRDEDFATVLGNLVLAGDDHGHGSALIPHQTSPDDVAPTVAWMHPPDGTEGLALTTRIGLSFSDHIDAASLSPSTVWLEHVDSGEAVPVMRSAQLGLVNLAPLEPLATEATYRVHVEGVLDVAGNPAPVFEGTLVTGDGSTGLSAAEVVPAVSNNSLLNTEYVISIFGEGAPVYIDRDFTFEAEHPVRFVGSPYIQTANNDKVGVSSDFVTFELAAAADVYVLYDDRADSLPDWLDSWTATGEMVGTTDADFTVHKKSFEAGTVQLGGNAAPGASGQDSMYSIVLVPQPLACDLALPPALEGTVGLSSQGPAGARYDWQVGEVVLEDAGSTPSVDLGPGRHGVLVTVSDPPRSATCSGVQIVHRPLADEPARTSSRVVFAEGRAVHTQPDNGRVAAVDVASGSVAWTADVGGRPGHLALDPAGDLWVTDEEGARLVVLDGTTGAEERTISLPRASAPWAVVVSPAGEAWVTLSATGEVVHLSAEGDELGRAAALPTARGLTLFGGKLYVSRFLSPEDHGEIHVLDAATLAAEGLIELAFDEGPDTEATGRGVPNYLSALQVSPDGRYGFVTGKKDNTARGLFRDGEELTFESRVRAFLSVIDLETGEEVIERRRDINDRDLVLSSVVSSYGDVVFAVSMGGNTVDVFETETGRRVSQFDVGKAPRGVALSPDGSRLAVTNFLSRSLSLFDTGALVSGTGNHASELGEVVTVDDEALDEVVLEGKRVFFDASDPRMSRDGYLSCASCHLDGGHDGRVWDFTQVGEGLRNTISLLGRAGTGHGNVHWTANFDEIQDFENDIRGGFGGEGFLTDEDFEATADPLGAPKAGRSSELDALAAYVASLTEVPASPWRRHDGSMTIEARRGREVFLAADCQGCHAGPAFTDFERHDVGTVHEGSGQGISAPLEGVGFDTPTLLGIWRTAPYLHDGSAATLADALDEHGEIPALSPEDLEDLVAYLLQLDPSSGAPEDDCADHDECVDGEAPDGGPDPDGGGDGDAPDGGGDGDGDGDAPDGGGDGDGDGDAGDGDGDPGPGGCGCDAQQTGGLSPLLGLLLLAWPGLRRRARRRRR